MMNKCFFKNAAIIAPLLLYASASFAFDITTDTTTPVTTDEAENSVSNAGTITIDGTPSDNSEAAILIDGTGEDLSFDGTITIRDQDGDGADVTLDDAYGIRLDGTGNFITDILLQENARIFIDEIDIVDTDSDDDDIVETPTAQTIATRIGLSIENALTGNLIGERGSAIAIDGNGDDNHKVRGVSLEAALTGDVELGTLISIVGDKSVGVYIGNTISGLYRQRGGVSVTGDNASAIIIDGAISKNFQLEAAATARGVAHTQSDAGVEESELDLAAEKSQSGTAVKISANIGEGVLINGAVNRLVTDDERDDLATIREKRATDEAVTTDKTDPYHYDENRRTGSIISYGSAPALEIDGGASRITIGRVTEYLLDTTNDDNDEDDALDIFDNSSTFLFSHSFINRGTISALGHNDSVAATGVKIGNATLTGGILNMGSISATAYNENATAIDIGAAAQMGAGTAAEFLNEGTISAQITSNAITKPAATKSAYAATAIKLSAGASLSGGAEFINAGTVTAQAQHLYTDENDETQSENGVNAIAFDFANYGGAIDLTQRLKVADSLSNGRYQASGDTDIDSQSAALLPLSITGDILFNNSNNILTVQAGEIVGNIYFGGGTDSLILSNTIPDTDDSDDFVAPTTIFRGSISKGAGTLNITIGDGAQLHFDGQAGNDPRSDPETPDDFENLAVNNLTANDGSELVFSIDTNELTDGAAILNVGTLTLAGDYTITPIIGSVSTSEQSIKLIDASNDLSSYTATIGEHLGGNHPYIYDTSLTIDDTDDNVHVVLANFAIKTAEELGLGQTESDTWAAVLAYFANDEITDDDARNARAAALTFYTEKDDFLAGYGSLLPHYGDGIMQQLASFNSAANNSIAQQMALVRAGTRNKDDGWIQQFGENFMLDKTDNRSAVSAGGYGVSFGYDMPMAGLDIIGLFGQLAYTDVEEKNVASNEVKGENFSGGIYAAQDFGALQFELTAHFGTGQLESSRQVRFGTLGDVLEGGWDVTTQGGSAKFIWPAQFGRIFWQAELSTEFFEVEQDAYSERDVFNSGLAMRLGAANSSLTTTNFGIRGGTQFGDDDPIIITWRPNFYLGYKTISSYSPYEVRAQFADDTLNEHFTLKNYDEPEDRALLGFGLSARNDYFALEMRYSGSFGDDGDSHAGGLGVRLYF
ncbi:MAG: autotransporter outer membrane beta-barrel domain-containing protein [Parvibaculales bacterium]